MRVIYQNLPCKIKGFCLRTFDSEDCYTIVLNARHSAETNKKTLLHELEHIKNDDFRNMLSADQIETLRHVK